MFKGCTSLTQAPELPATTLADYCYEQMFRGCTSLIIAPELPATTLKTHCYSNMFYGCTSLSSINVHFTAWNPTNATSNWVNGVNSSGTFTCPNALDTNNKFGNNYIPSGWTIQTI